MPTSRRFDLEHTFRFLKQTLGWTTPRVRHPEQADRWTWLVVAAYTQLRLARARVADRRLPWERRYDAGRLTPTGSTGRFRRFWRSWARPRSRQNPAGGRPGRPKGRRLGPGQALPGHQEEPLEPAKTASEGFCDGHKAHRKTLVLKTQQPVEKPLYARSEDPSRTQ